MALLLVPQDQHQMTELLGTKRRSLSQQSERIVRFREGSVRHPVRNARSFRVTNL
jgi:hypothetical protein